MTGAWDDPSVAWDDSDFDWTGTGPQDGGQGGGGGEVAVATPGVASGVGGRGEWVPPLRAGVATTRALSMALRPTAELLSRLGVPTSLSGQVAAYGHDTTRLATLRQKVQVVRDGVGSISDTDRDSVIARVFLGG